MPSEQGTHDRKDRKVKIKVYNIMIYGRNILISQ